MAVRDGRTGGPSRPGRRAPGAGPWRHGAAALRLRRVLGALMVAAAAGIAVEALVPHDLEAAPSALTAAADLPAGHVLVSGDLVPVALPEDATPAGALEPSQVDDVDGRRLAGAVGAGEVVTDARLTGPGLLAGQPAGTVAIAVPVLPASADLVHPGDDVTVLAGSTDPLTGALVAPDDVLPADATSDGATSDGAASDEAVDDRPPPSAGAPRAVVLDLPSTSPAGSLGGVGADVSGGVVVLAVAATDAARLAQAVAEGAPVVLAVLP